MEEVWKNVKGYEGLYEVSNMGNVRSLDRVTPSRNRFSKMNMHFKGRKMKPFSDKGYLRLELAKNKTASKKFIHRLICEAFIPNPENKPMINHKNGIRNDNRIENLEWVTASENCRHSWDVLKNPQPLQMKGKFGADHPTSKPVEQCTLDGDVIKVWGSLRLATMTLNLSYSMISKCLRGTLKNYKGFIWRRATIQEIAI